MSRDFDDSTAVTGIGSGRYAADLSGEWQVGGGINGGYLLAVVGNAIRTEVPGKPDPLSVSAYYQSASTAGPAEVEVTVRRDGGTLCTVQADLRQGGADRILALATYGDLDRLGDDVGTTAVEPAMPAPEECVSSEHAPEEVLRMAPMLRRLDLRFHPDQIGWAVGKPGGDAVMSAWVKLAEGDDLDTTGLLMVVDCLPPTVFGLGMVGWAPTIELTAHIRARPAPGWLKVRHTTSNLAGGMFEEDCEVWDSTGRLVAQSRQLARQPRGRAG